MSLELTLLLTVFGMLFISLSSGEGGFQGQFEVGAPFLAGRMVRDMTTGRCFNVQVGGGPPSCIKSGGASVLFETAVPVK